MRNKTLRRFAQVTAFMAAAAFHHGVYALQVTLSLPDCPAGSSLSFNSATNTLSCSGAQIPTSTLPGSCSISAQPNSDPNNTLAPGTAVTLTASCGTGTTPIVYNWNIGLQGAFTATPTATTTYTVTPANAAGNGLPLSTTVYITGAPAGPTPPTGCSISQSPNTVNGAVNAGTTVTMSLTCSGGSPVTSCSWTNGLGNACTVQVSAPSQNTTYSATAANAAGSATAQASIYVIAQQIPQTVAPQNYCTGSDQIVNLSYPDGGQIKPRTSGFGNQVVAFKFTVPTTFTRPLNPANIGFMRVAEVPGTSVTSRDFTVSKSPCDFNPGSHLLADGMGFGDTAPMVTFTVNNPNGHNTVGAFMNLNSGDTVYFNIRNKLNGFPTCAFSSCDILFDFASPNRY